MPDYHKLEVWVLACEISDRVVELVDTLGKRLRPHKADQLLRAADAIHENIAEGCGFNSDPQLAKYLRQARGSADELQDELETLVRRRLILPASRTCFRRPRFSVGSCRGSSTLSNRAADRRKPAALIPKNRKQLTTAGTANSHQPTAHKPPAEGTAASRLPAVRRSRRPRRSRRFSRRAADLCQPRRRAVSAADLRQPRRGAVSAAGRRQPRRCLHFQNRQSCPTSGPHSSTSRRYDGSS